MKRAKEFTVLVVEDDLNDIFFVKRAFAKVLLDLHLEVVTDGEEATRYLLGQGAYADRLAHPLPNLIVTDIKMPRKTGYKLVEWVKGNRRFRCIPVVMVSSSDLPEDISRSYDLGANAYMIKPTAFDAVQELYQNIVDYWAKQCATIVVAHGD